MNPHASLSPSTFILVLENRNITHVLGIPDNTSGPVFDRLSSGDGPRLITVSREGEAFAVASGLWVGGAAPLVLIQNTGLLESGDALRGTAMRMGVPLPVVVTGRGYGRMEAAGVLPGADLERGALVRVDVDSVALHTEPTLHAWSVPHRVAPPEPTAGHLAGTIDAARERSMPVALVLSGPLAAS